ncbi:hypothetical protein [Pseudoalteromonas sp. T1lg88]|uniref:hypothetical protein n=1 Tax=Pseudoalteromonas sp. T1lg88 TaxID=2077104 RepID=UPI000CF6A391|nr:hypothetical protein [Pseudoalteromonas sp. T1lg88]
MKTSIIKNLFLYALLPLFVLWAWEQYSKEKEHVVVTSTPIVSTSFTNPGNSDFLKTYTIRNEGNKAAQDVLFVFNDNVKNHQIIKSAAQDMVSVMEPEGKLEIKYANLTPTSEFTVMLLLDSDSPIEPVVKHLNGVATKATDHQGILEYANLLMLCAAFIYFALSLRCVFYNSYRIYLPKHINERKPWYLTNKEHEEFIISSLPNILSPNVSNHLSSPSDLNTIKASTVITELVKSSRLSQKVKDEIGLHVNKVFVIESEIALLLTSSIEVLESFASFEKPVWVTSDSWAQFQSKVIKRVEVISSELHSAYEFEKKATAILSTIKSGELVGLSHSEYTKWIKAYKAGLKNLLTNYIASDSFYGTIIKIDELSPFIEALEPRASEQVRSLICIRNIFAGNKFANLATSKIKGLKAQIDSKPDWADTNVWPSYVSVLKDYLDYLELKESSEKLLPELTSLLQNSQYEKDVNPVEALYLLISELKDFKTSLANKGQALEVKESELNSLEHQTNTLLEQLRLQLSFIDDTLNGGRNFELEEYPEKLFKPQNIRNLKQVSELIKS